MKSYFDDAGLLGILEDDFTSKRKIENSPPKKAVYQFGRPKTPDIQSNKSKDKQSIDEKMIITSFHGPKSTNISIDRLKKKVSAPGATSTDYVSRNKDLSSVAIKKQKEDEQKSPKKNKKYENVTPRYMNTISNGDTKQNGQQAIETDKDGVFGQGKKGTNRDSLNPPQWVDSTKRENTMREDSFLDMQQLQARVIENIKPFVENEKSGRSKSPIVNGTLNDQRALKTSQVAINSHRNSQAEVKLNKRPSVSPSFAKNQTKPTQAAEEQVTRKLTKPVQANAQTKISNKEKDQSKKENQEPPKIKPSLMESLTSGRINEPKKSEPLEVLPSSNNRPISPVQNNKSNKKQDNKYKPETIDLCMKLEEYTKYKENLNSMNNDKAAGAPSRQNQPQTYSQTRLQKMNKNNDSNMNHIQSEETENKENSNPEQFLMKKINNFKDNSSKKRRPSTSADKKRVSQPKYIKKAIEFEQYSYQPMLSKKSLQLAEKKGYTKDQLYRSRTPTKNDDEVISAPYQTEQFHPKLCEKSKYIDQVKHRQNVPRYEMLNRIGQEYSNKKKKNIKQREKEEENELRAHSFQPSCQKIRKDPHIKETVDIDIADRNEKWVQRRDEKLSKLKGDFERNQGEHCSFKPKITKYEKEDKLNDSQYYSSVFVKDGIKNYFTRLEQARRIKKEAQNRLDNWGRGERSKSVQKNLNKEGSHQRLEFSRVSKFNSPSEEELPFTKGPHWETPGTRDRGYSSKDSKDISENQSLGQPSVEKTISILRENLKKIQIHLN